MAEYMDLDILRKRAENLERMEEEAEIQEEESIFNGKLQINLDEIIFSERTILEDKAGMWMPSEFKEMTKTEIEKNYILGNRPQVIWTSSDFHMHLGFQHTSHECSDADLYEFVKTAENILEKVGPKVTIYGKGSERIGEHPLFYLEMVSHTLASAIYSLVFFCVLEKHVLIGFMNFDYSLLVTYRSAAKEMLGSFRFKE